MDEFDEYFDFPAERSAYGEWYGCMAALPKLSGAKARTCPSSCEASLLTLSSVKLPYLNGFSPVAS
jgi:hypothetical protein